MIPVLEALSKGTRVGQPGPNWGGHATTLAALVFSSHKPRQDSYMVRTISLKTRLVNQVIRRANLPSFNSDVHCRASWHLKESSLLAHCERRVESVWGNVGFSPVDQGPKGH